MPTPVSNHNAKELMTIETAQQNTEPQSSETQLSEARVAEAAEQLAELTDSVARVVVGQRPMIEGLLIGLLTGGHVLLEGVPGLAKTLTVSSLAGALDASFARVQFTPDLLPADIVGTLIYSPRDGTFSAKPGPIFANIVLADEINRAPAKVQSALLEAMQERQVTLGDETRPLPHPFLVLATQNPLEQEGTYPLPEAQVDRFMLKLRIGYPTRDDERTIVDRMASSQPTSRVERVMPLDRILALRASVDQIRLDPKVRDYIVDLVHASREPAAIGAEDTARLIEFGCSPRASIALAQAGRAHALLRGRHYTTPTDIKAVAPDVMRHRLIPSYEAEAENITADDLVKTLLDRTPSP
ncbi:MAG: MoxR family ATPase [Planctomycetota bacterium]